MKQCKNKIECQRSIKICSGQIRVRPRSEKNECSQPSEGINNSQSAFEQREREKAKIDNENIAEQKRWPVRDRWE